MNIRKFNWLTWAGFLLCVFAFLSYPFLFARWPVTGDFPWANLLLFGIAAALLLFGVKRAFAPERRRRSKVAASVVVTLSVIILGLFIFTFLVIARWLPASHGAPQAGQKAPAFSLADTNGRQVSLSELLSAPINGKAGSPNPKGVLLIFYRGYW